MRAVIICVCVYGGGVWVCHDFNGIDVTNLLIAHVENFLEISSMTVRIWLGLARRL